MLTRPFEGANYLFRGLKLLGAAGVKKFVVIPLFINIAVFTLLLWLAIDRFGMLIDGLMPRLPDWMAWLNWLVWALFGLAFIAIVFFTFALVANVIAAPFNGLLAEAVEHHLTGSAPASGDGIKTALQSVPRQILDELRKLGYYLKWSIPLLLIFVVPLINLVAPFLWALFGAWMMAVQYADYPLGNHGLRGAEQRRLLGRSRLITLGFGGATMFATMLPIVNLFVMPAAVAGATAMVVERFRKN